MRLLKICVVVVFFFGFIFFLNENSYAAGSENVVETVYFGNLKDDGGGCGVYTVLNSVLDILSIGVGMLAFIGISVVGIKYITAKGNVEQTKKAKNRIMQIVVGLVVYVLLYAGVQFLLPGGHFNGQSCTVVSDEELAQIREKEKKTEANNNSKKESNTTSATTSKMTNAQKLIAKAKELAWPKGTSTKKYYYAKGGSATGAFKKALDAAFPNRKKWNTKSRKGVACDVFVSTTVRASGLDSKFPRGFDQQLVYKSSKFDRFSCKNCNAYKKSKAGDIIVYWKNKAKDEGHVLIRGDGVVYEAQMHAHGGTYGHVGSTSKLNKKFQQVVILRPKG